MFTVHTELTCYTNVQPGTPGDVALGPVGRGDGNTVCFKAQLKQPTHKGSWVYGVTDDATCAVVLQTDESRIESMFQHMTCCATPKCNAPNLRIDPTTAVKNGVGTAQRSVLCAVVLVLTSAVVLMI